MFRDLKEYQEIQKLYENKVSKTEKLDEFVGLGVKQGVDSTKTNSNQFKSIKNSNNNMKFSDAIKAGEDLKKTTTTTDNNLSNKDKSDIKKEDDLQKVLNNKKELQKIEADANAKAKLEKNKKEVDFRLKNTESSEDSFKGDNTPEKRKLTGAERAKLIARARIKSGKTISQVNAANKQSMRDRARARNEKFKAERKKKLESKKLGRPQPKVKSPMDMRNESYDAYDIVLEYLLSTEQVATIEEANYIMTEMDSENIQEIVKTGLSALKAIGKFGAKSPTNFGITMAGTGLVGDKVVKPVVTKLANALNTPKNNTSNFNPLGNFIDKKRNEKGGGNYRVDEVEKNAGVESGFAGEKINFGNNNKNKKR